jgi:hypothetical protein
MDCGDRVGVAIWRIDRKTGMESLCLGDVSRVSQRDVCLYVALLRECRVAGMASDSTSRDNSARQLYAVCGGVVVVARAIGCGRRMKADGETRREIDGVVERVPNLSLNVPTV